jgi:hypothetical protein
VDLLRSGRPRAAPGQPDDRFSVRPDVSSSLRGPTWDLVVLWLRRKGSGGEAFVNSFGQHSCRTIWGLAGAVEEAVSTSLSTLLALSNRICAALAAGSATVCQRTWCSPKWQQPRPPRPSRAPAACPRSLRVRHLATRIGGDAALSLTWKAAAHSFRLSLAQVKRLSYKYVRHVN